MRQTSTIASKLSAIIVVSCVFACVFLSTSLVRAADPKEATLEVKSKKETGFYSYEFYLNEKLLLTVKPGEDKQCQFTPDTNGTTTIRRVVWSAFGTKTNECDCEFKIGPGGVATFDERNKYFVTKSGLDVSKLKVVLDDESSEREIASEVVETPPGAKRTIKRTRTIERSVSVTETDSVEKSIAAKISIFSGEIRAKIEKSRSTTYKETEMIEQAVEIDGKELPKARLVWVERTVKGKATVSIDGKETEVPFTFRESLELRVKPVK